MTFLSIVIPHHSESERGMFPLLASIEGQVGIDLRDVEVVVCNDGGARPLGDAFVGLFPSLSVRQVGLPENQGPGAARQAGIDACGSEYVMFCDADDVLHNVGALGALIEAARAESPDVLASAWLEELPNGEGGMCYLRHDHENTWMHGKLLRVAWLRERGIRHHPALRVHEDTYFLSVAAAHCAKRVDIDAVTYVWRFRDGSITRRDGARYTWDSMPVFVYAVTEAMREAEAASPDSMPERVAQLVLYIFYGLHRRDWDGHEGERAATERQLAAGLAPYWHYWESADEGLLARIAASERAKHCDGVERETVWQWVDGVRREAGREA